MPDVPVCTELALDKGWCTNTISDQEYYIDEARPRAFNDGEKPKTWWELRPFMVMLPFPSWAELKAYLIKQCKRNNCDQYIKSWERRVNKMDDKVKNE